jgi:hypothetical protein
VRRLQSALKQRIGWIEHCWFQLCAVEVLDRCRERGERRFEDARTEIEETCLLEGIHEDDPDVIGCIGELDQDNVLPALQPCQLSVQVQAGLAEEQPLKIVPS